MPVGIVQAVNNTSHVLKYVNTETGHKFTVLPKTEQYENDGWMPSSDFHDDTLPYHNSGSVEIQLDELPPMKISDHDWRFSIVGPSSSSSDHQVDDLYGHLENGGQYVVRVDEVRGQGVCQCAISIYKYDSSIKSDSGYIASHILQHAAVAVGLVLMAIFF